MEVVKRLDKGWGNNGRLNRGGGWEGEGVT